MNNSTLVASLKQISLERKIEIDVIVEAVKDAMRLGYKSAFDIGERDLIEVDIDLEKNMITVFLKKTVVSKIKDKNLEISLADAQKIDPSLSLGDEVMEDITAEGDFGRIAAQTARQVILQTLKESERDSAIKETESRIDQIENFTIQRVIGDGEVVGEVFRARAVMKKEDRIPFEFYPLGGRIKVVILGIEEDSRGKFVRVSRSSNKFTEALFKMEVPELESNTVEIVSIAREAGSRTKIAVKSNTAGIDPVGSFIGQKGIRITSVMNEVKIGKGEEKIDVIPFSSDIETYLKNSIKPAVALEVQILDSINRKARVIVSEEHYSLAIGREGQNARLASKLTGWDIDIKSDKDRE